MSRKPCHFQYTPGGCRKGGDCTFYHAATRGVSSTSSPGSTHRPQDATKAPPGVCIFYWSSGQCNRGFECRYKHIINTRIASPSRSESHLSITDSIAPFLTKAGLAKLNESSTDVFFSCSSKSMTPSEAHNSLRKYLSDDFRFSKTFDIYGFLIPLGNANSSNSTWVSWRFSVS